MASFDVVIVGGGIMGAFAAGELGGQGATVALLDQSVLPNPNAASVDHSKVFRFAYPDQFYVRLAVDSLKGWRNLENECDLTLLLTSGVILLSTGEGSFESDTYHALKSCGLETQLLDAQQTSTRFPQFDTSGTTFSVFDPSGAVLLAEKSLRAALDVAINRGVRIFEHSRVIELRSSRGSVELRTEQGDNLVCAKAIAAAGPWTRLLLPELNKRLTTTHQDVAYFEPAADRAASFEPNEFPIFIELESGFYGFPIHHDGAMKIANHHKGAVADPDTDKEGVADGFVDDCRAFFRKSIPGLADARVAETRVCFYNNTADDDFIIDWHPDLEGVLIVTGFSGHGFKFGPAIGRIVADLLLKRRIDFDLDRFRLSRFET